MVNKSQCFIYKLAWSTSLCFYMENVYKHMVNIYETTIVTNHQNTLSNIVNNTLSNIVKQHGQQSSTNMINKGSVKGHDFCLINCHPLGVLRRMAGRVMGRIKRRIKRRTDGRVQGRIIATITPPSITTSELGHPGLGWLVSRQRRLLKFWLLLRWQVPRRTRPLRSNQCGILNHSLQWPRRHPKAQMGLLWRYGQSARSLQLRLQVTFSC
jgi:hypothetical protein